MISVSYLNSIYDKRKTVELIDKIGDANFIHIDLMDGKYVEEKNFEIKEVIDLFKDINKDKDVHLMVNNPENYIDDLLKINPKIITFHPDACTVTTELIDLIKSKGIKVGIAINSYLEVSRFEYLLDRVDNVLVMSVKAGKGGQEFIPDTYTKLEHLKMLKKGNNFTIEVDGGINKEIYNKLKDLDVDIFVIGSYICMNENFERPIKELINN